MRTRVLTYDLNGGSIEDYNELYEWFKSVNAKKLTESTYAIETDLSQEDFVSKVKSLFNKNDTIYWISANNDGLFYNKITV